MKKLFISADIEGTAGIVDWNETLPQFPEYAYFAAQMTREVNAACEGAIAAGVKDIVIKDAHEFAQNINPAQLPQCAQVIRGWSQNPFSMMFGLDDTFDGVVLTGYHSGAGLDCTPLAHTVSHPGNMYVKINGQLANEMLINAMTASYVGVPVYCVTGDRGLCEWTKSINPHIHTVAISEGVGFGSVSIHPDLAVERIRKAVEESLAENPEDCMFPLPEDFDVEICFKEHGDAYKWGFYPGAEQTGPHTVRFYSKDYFAVLTFLHYAL
ncbi:MAG: M55 family metallopeptidase [Oscillibacter sp.]|jgi:D-amino peptidase|nr:M55 family metallopeptidase [Oscillibacter sp.]